MKKTFLVLACLLFIIFLVGCQESKEISEQEAITVTQDFVNNNVKFFTQNESDSPVVQRANIAVLETEKRDGNWFIVLRVESIETGELRQVTIVTVVDAKKGVVTNVRKLNDGSGESDQSEES